MNLVSALAPELILIVTAGVLFLLGMSNKPGARKLAPILALISLVWVFLMQLRGTPDNAASIDVPGMIRVSQMATYIQMLAAGVGVLFVLLSWPTDAEATGNSALNFNTECGEYFGLMLLAITGIFLVAATDD